MFGKTDSKFGNVRVNHIYICYDILYIYVLLINVYIYILYFVTWIFAAKYDELSSFTVWRVSYLNFIPTGTSNMEKSNM